MRLKWFWGQNMTKAQNKTILLIGCEYFNFFRVWLIYQSLITLFFLSLLLAMVKKSAIRYILFFVISVVLKIPFVYFSINFLLNLILFILVIECKFFYYHGKWILFTFVSSAVYKFTKISFQKTAHNDFCNSLLNY